MKDWFDYLLGKVTMYRLVTISLSALLVLSIFLGAVGYLPYSPVSLLLTSLLLVSTSYAANRFHGWLFDVKPHGESAAITGLILTFILAPVTTPVSAIPLMLIAIIATASKYILAFRGRHVFNPAAVGVLFASLSGLSYAIWWVASPALIPLTVFIAFLILYKTRHVKLGLLFIALTVVFITSQYMLVGEPLQAALVTVVTSWPIIFFAGVMLIEPLTLPPRRWQQLAVVVLVAAAFSAPIEFGSVSMTPQLALIIGNSAAFAWGTRQAVKLKFVKKEVLTPTSYEFVFEGNGRLPKYIAGQYMELNLPHKKADIRGSRRMFTIASHPNDNMIRVGTKIPEKHSSFKSTLAHLKAGDDVSAVRISGDFILPADHTRQLLFIAGGIGITPFVSFLRQLDHDNDTRDIVLVYSVNSAEEVAYIDGLVKSSIRVIVVCPNPPKQRKNIRYVDAPFITKEILEQAVPDIVNRQTYISGPPLMVSHVKRIAKKLRARSVKTDYFTGY